MRNAFRTTEGVDLMVDWPIHAGASLAKSLNENGLPSTFQYPVAALIPILVPGARVPSDAIQFFRLEHGKRTS